MDNKRIRRYLSGANTPKPTRQKPAGRTRGIKGRRGGGKLQTRRGRNSSYNIKPRPQELSPCLGEERLLTNPPTEGGLRQWLKELEAHITQYGGTANYPAGECFGTTPGTSQNRDTVCGDLNGDGGHNVLDIVAMAGCVLANPGTACVTTPWQDVYGCHADMNNDGGLNVLDIVGLVNCVLSGAGCDNCCGGEHDDCSEGYDECGVCDGDGSTCAFDECEDIDDCVDFWGEWYNIETTTYLDICTIEANLERMEAGQNAEFPDGIGLLTSLETLTTGNGQGCSYGYPCYGDCGHLIGEIPPEIGDLTNLTNLSLSSNQLTGEIPSTIGELENLTTLSLSSNQLTGEIPSTIGDLENLTHLYLHYNQLTGEIPVGFGSIPNLACFNVSSNQLTGTLPTDIAYINSRSICNCKVDVRNNQLSGELFWELCYLWYECGMPIHPKFSGNKFCPDEFTGEWPLCPWPMDGTYDTEDQVFFGTRLRNDMGYQDTSECPGDGINWSMDCNGFAYPVGGIPEFVNLWENFGGDCYNVAEPTYNNQLMLGYDLEHGQTIPPEIGLLTSLTKIALQSNGLIGGIPSEIGYLPNLTHLWLKNNQLTGVIPQAVCDLMESNNIDMNNILEGNNLTNNC